MNDELQLKIVVVGDMGVGKSALANRFVHKSFDDRVLQSTIGFDSLSSTGIFGQYTRRNVTAVLWDTAGQERFRALTRNFYSRANGIVVVYDASMRTTREDIERSLAPWFRDIAAQKLDDRIPIVIAGNKCDIYSVDLDDPEESFDDLGGVAAECGVSRLFSIHHTSALTGEGVDSLFGSLIDTIVDHAEVTGGGVPVQGSISLTSPRNDTSERSCSECVRPAMVAYASRRGASDESKLRE